MRPILAFIPFIFFWCSSPKPDPVRYPDPCALMPPAGGEGFATWSRAKGKHHIEVIMSARSPATIATQCFHRVAMNFCARDGFETYSGNPVIQPRLDDDDHPGVIATGDVVCSHEQPQESESADGGE